MRVVVIGATGNIGTSLVRALSRDDSIEAIIGCARRRPELEIPKVSWVSANIERDDLRPVVEEADAVVHLAWRIQPSRNLNALWRTNVVGSSRIFEAAREAGVTTIVYSSSVGVYSAGPADRRVDEDWPRDGIPSSFYARHKAEVERRLDAFERESPGIRVVRIRPALVFKREAASGIRRLFLGPFLPSPLLHSRLVRLVPDVRGLSLQAVHGDDLAEAFRLVLTRPVTGAFNVAAEPVMGAADFARLAQARTVPVPPALVRAAAAVTWALRLQPSPPGWIDLALNVPVMDATRARDELGWMPATGADEALRELVRGLRERDGAPTPPLDASAGGLLRAGELATGVGARDDAA